MNLNHVNLPVADVSATRDFFEKHFGFHRIAEPTDANVVLTDNAGLVLTISNFDHADEVTYPKWFHVGFMQDSDDKVDDIYERLKTAGMQPGKPKDMHGARTFYFTAPGGFTVEVFHHGGKACCGHDRGSLLYDFNHCSDYLKRSHYLCPHKLFTVDV